MKFSTIIFLLLLPLCFSDIAFSQANVFYEARLGNDGDHPGRENDGDHGGNPVLSSQQTVEEAINNLYFEVSRAIGWLASGMSKLPPNKEKEILSHLLYAPTTTEFQYKKVKSFPTSLPFSKGQKTVYYLTEGDCPGTSKAHATASTKLGIVGAPICFSLPRLRMISPSAIKEQLIAIAIHEHAHQYGYEEQDATFIQNLFASNEGVALRTKDEKLSKYIAEFNKLTNELDAELAANSSDSLVCRALGQMERQMEHIAFAADDFISMYIISRRLFDIYPTMYRAEYFRLAWYEAVVASNFCGVASNLKSIYPDNMTGDRVKLREQLNKIDSLLNKAVTSPRPVAN